MRAGWGVVLAAWCAAPAGHAAPDRGDFCQGPSECRFDRPCAPTSCGRAPADAGATVCLEGPAADAGVCGCLSHVCTWWRPAPVTAGSVACGTDSDCAMDHRQGVCVAGPAHHTPIEVTGQFCRCDKARGAAGGRCVVEQVQPVPCRSYRDCSHLSAPIRPVPASRVKRRHAKPVRPCKDSETDSVCVPAPDGGAGTCRVVRWSC